MRYCNRCILPDTRPGITLDEAGVCSGCRGHDDKENRIDWPAREKAFQDLVADARRRSSGYASGYDCIVPVSGGKDSWYQIIKAREYGLKILGITWKTPARTGIGQANMDNMIKKLGIDHIDYSINPEVERRFMKAAFEHSGATGLPMHMALFAIPIRLAVQMKIPLVIWGENAQLEYGGNEAERLATKLDQAWLEKHGCLQSTTAADWVGREGLCAEDLIAYKLPRKADFEVHSLFLGAFFKWNSYENAALAKRHGFQHSNQDLKVGTWDFADIDCHFISLHHLTKWEKFGITRDFDNLSIQIRYGMISREAAIRAIADKGRVVPEEDIRAFCEFQGLDEEWFWRVSHKFRNTEIWQEKDGIWMMPDFLIEDWDWQ